MSLTDITYTVIQWITFQQSASETDPHKEIEHFFCRKEIRGHKTFRLFQEFKETFLFLVIWVTPTGGRRRKGTTANDNQ